MSLYYKERIVKYRFYQSQVLSVVLVGHLVEQSACEHDFTRPLNLNQKSRLLVTLLEAAKRGVLSLYHFKPLKWKKAVSGSGTTCISGLIRQMRCARNFTSS